MKKSAQQNRQKISNFKIFLVKVISENALFVYNIILYSCLNILYIVDLHENFSKIIKKVDLAFFTDAFSPLSPDTNNRLEVLVKGWVKIKYSIREEKNNADSLIQ